MYKINISYLLQSFQPRVLYLPTGQFPRSLWLLGVECNSSAVGSVYIPTGQFHSTIHGPLIGVSPTTEVTYHWKPLAPSDIEIHGLESENDEPYAKRFPLQPHELDMFDRVTMPFEMVDKPLDLRPDSVPIPP